MLSTIFTLGIIGAITFIVSPIIMIVAQGISSRKGK